MILSRKFIKNKKTSIIFLVLLIFFFLKLTNFPKNVYDLLKDNYEERFISSYNNVFYSGFCNKSSHGYIYHIYKKFSKTMNQNSVPKIINLDPIKRKKPYWIFLFHDPKINQDEIILLNYDQSLSNFDLKKYEILDNHQNKCLFLRKND